MSGGNRQKVILARWMAAHPDILILDEPTKGIDAGAKSEIYQTVCDLAKLGMDTDKNIQIVMEVLQHENVNWRTKG